MWCQLERANVLSLRKYHGMVVIDKGDGHGFETTVRWVSRNGALRQAVIKWQGTLTSSHAVFEYENRTLLIWAAGHAVLRADITEGGRVAHDTVFRGGDEITDVAVYSNVLIWREGKEWRASNLSGEKGKPQLPFALGDICYVDGQLVVVNEGLHGLRLHWFCSGSHCMEIPRDFNFGTWNKGFWMERSSGGNDVVVFYTNTGEVSKTVSASLITDAELGKNYIIVIPRDTSVFVWDNHKEKKVTVELPQEETGIPTWLNARAAHGRIYWLSSEGALYEFRVEELL